MNIFSARFDVVNTQSLSEGTYKITGDVVDNTGKFFATNVNVGDIIYIDGSPIGSSVLRYKIDSIDPSTTGASLTANISWDMQDEPAIDIYDGANGVIGEKNQKLNTAALTSIFVNMASESLISNVRNYESGLIGDITDDLKISINELSDEVSNEGMKKSVYDVTGDGIVDRTALADSVEYVNILNKPEFKSIAETASYNDLIDKPAIPTKTSDLDLDNVYNKTEADTLLDNKANSIDVYDKTETYNKTETDTLLDNKANSIDVYNKTETYAKTEIDTLLDSTGILRYGDENSTILATGTGVTITKTGNSAKINCPDGIKVISVTIRFSDTEIGTGGNCSIDYGSSSNYSGTGNNSDYSITNPPVFQVINDVAGSRAYKLLPYPAANLNTNAHTLQLTGLTASIGIFVRLIF